MLHNFIICVNAVVPSAIYLIIGILLRMFKVIKEEEVKRFTHVVFVTLYPFMMFDNIYGRDVQEYLRVGFVGYAEGFTLLEIVAAFIAVCLVVKDNYDRGAMIQAIFRSNIVLMGLPIAINLFGKSRVAPVAVVILFVVSTYAVASVILFEKFRGGHVDAVDLAKRIITNPIIVGGLAAIIAILLKIQLPEIIAQTVSSLSDCTAPIAMILLGAGLNIDDFTSDRKKLAFCSVGKLAVAPIFGITGAVLLGMRDVELIAIVLMMGGNGKLAGEIVVVTTIISCFTIPVWLFALKTMGMF